MKFRGLDRQVQKALKDAGAILVRSDRHFVYSIPGAPTLLVFSGSASDQRAIKNQLSDIRRLVRQRVQA